MLLVVVSSRNNQIINIYNAVGVDIGRRVIGIEMARNKGDIKDIDVVVVVGIAAQ